MYRLIYFSSPGRAEAIRIVLDISKLSWENVIVDFSGYSEMRDSKNFLGAYCLHWKPLQGH